MAALGASLFSAITAAIANDKEITIALIGDSTVTDSAGWGKAFATSFGDRVLVKNFAVGGRSSKSFFDEGRLPAVIELKPDYVFIQFGHNGQPGKGARRETDPETTYRDFLRMYVKEFQEIGSKPILVSSVSRRRRDKNGKLIDTLEPWAEAARAVAKEMKIPFIDLHQVSINVYKKIGAVASAEFNLKEGDYTHFNEKGSKVIASLVVGEMKKAVPKLTPYLRPVK